MRLLPDVPQGRPSLDLSDDEIATVVDLLCRGAAAAKSLITGGMLEVPITLQLKKTMRKLKKNLGLSNLEIAGEFELLDTSNDDPEVLGRIDVVMKFLHQFGDEEAYLGVECKRVAEGEATLNHRYVAQGVNRFATGKYSKGHHWGMMLGYVVEMPIGGLVPDIDNRIRRAYGEEAKLDAVDGHANSLAMNSSRLKQGGHGHVIRLLHIFVDMIPVSDGGTRGEHSA